MKKMKRNILLVLLLINGIGILQAQEPLLLTLEKALEIAISENPTIKIADKEIEKQKYAKKETWGYLMPSVDLIGGYDRNIKKMVMSFEGQTVTIGSDNSYNGGISMAMPILNMRLLKMPQLSEINIQMALESSRESKLSLKNEVQKAFYFILLAQEMHIVMQKGMDNAQGNYSNAKNKFEQGLVAEYDLIRAEVQVSNLRPNLITAENNVKLAEFQLKLLLGLPIEEFIKAEGLLSNYESEYQLFNELYDFELKNNASLKKLDIQSQLLDKQLELEKTSYLPTLNLSFNYLFMSMNNDFKISDYDWHRTSTLGLSLRVPIFSGFTRKNKIAQIRTSIEALNLQRDFSKDRLKVQVKNTLISMQKAIEQLESNKTGIRSAEKAFSISQARYKSGLGTMLELNDAEIALTQAKLNYNQSIYDYMAAKSDYDLLIGQD